MIFGKISDRQANDIVINKIRGINIYYDFLEKEEEYDLLNIIECLEWEEEHRHKVQYYGFKYNYNKRKSYYKDYIGRIPKNLDFIKEKLGFDYMQLVIDKYSDDQGMRYHKKSGIFDTNIILSPLNSDCVMYLRKDDIVEKIILKRRSIVVLGDNILKNWEIGIPFKKYDKFNNRIVERLDDRIVMTFRNILLDT
jgi:hypothetical protein